MDEKALIQEISFPTYQAKGWMKLIGVMSIIYGALMILSLWGILVCWLPIWMGVLLIQASNLINNARVTGDKIRLMESLSKIKTYFIVTGVLVLIGLIVLGIILFIFGGAILIGIFGKIFSVL